MIARIIPIIMAVAPTNNKGDTLNPNNSVNAGIGVTNQVNNCGIFVIKSQAH